MTTIFVENCLENGAVIQIVERFGGCAIHRSLKPGENARITLSRYKSIVVEPASTNGLTVDLAEVWAADPAGDTWPNFLQRRCG